ncbi:MAG: integration host factor subunit alpha [Pseudomonadota bacterium]
MENSTITRADLAEAVYEEVGLSRNESSDLVEAVLDEISDTLIKGDNVKLSSFGSFSIRQKGERVGRNPKTGVEVPILPRKVLVFRASHVLKDRINEATQRMNAGQPPSSEDGGFTGGSGGSGGYSGF